MKSLWLMSPLVASLLGENNLTLNVQKTKEMVFDFRRKESLELRPLEIGGQAVERVSEFRFLGTTISDNLNWGAHCSSVHRKAQQRLYFLRHLKKFRASRKLLLQFYRATVESVLTQSITIWYAAASEEDKYKLDRVIKSASKTVGCDLPSLSDIYTRRMTKRATNIARDGTHPASHLFTTMRSGRFRAIPSRTGRMGKSFFPCAVQCLNGNFTRGQEGP